MRKILRLISIFYRSGVRRFRLTGGEPTLFNYKGYTIVDLSRDVKEQFKDIDLAMTTNSVLLEDIADYLKKAGMDRLNISLDTLDLEKYESVSQKNKFNKVTNGIDRAIKA